MEGIFIFIGGVGLFAALLVFVFGGVPIKDVFFPPKKQVD